MRKDLISRGLQGAESRLALLLVLMTLGLTANAQLPKVACVTADRVNVRKFPSTSAPKLMGLLEKYCVTEIWSDENMANAPYCSPYQLTMGEHVNVLGNEGDWTMISIPSDQIESGWVLSKFLQEEKLENISFEEFYNSCRKDEVKTSGKYRGMVLTCTNDMDGEWELQYFHEGVLFTLAEFTMGLDTEYYKGKGIKLEKRDYSWSMAVGLDRRNVDGYQYDLNKFTDQEIEMLVKTLCNKDELPKLLTVFFEAVSCQVKMNYLPFLPDLIKEIMGLPVSKPKEEVKSESSQPVEKKQELKKNPVADDRDASFPGGEDGLNAWIKFQLKYSKVKKKGSVTVAFDVDKTGSVRNVSIERSADPALDREAMRIVQMMPKWTPGIKNGQYEVFRKEITIDFK